MVWLKVKARETKGLRDAGRFKERYDFSLDSRQLGLVLFAGLVAAAVLFVLGMSVGKQWERKKASANPPVAVIETHGPEDVVPAAPPVDSPPGEGVGQAEEEPAPAVPAEPVKEEPPAQTMEPEELTFPKVLAGKGKPVEPVPKMAGKPAVKGAYTIQVGAFKDKSTADGLSARLRKKGYSAGVHISGGLYRVHVGSFANKEDAVKTADRLASSEKLKPYVTAY